MHIQNRFGIDRRIDSNGNRLLLNKVQHLYTFREDVQKTELQKIENNFKFKIREKVVYVAPSLISIQEY